MPVYNGSQYLSETIHSIINQTYSEFEIIIIDDASNDNSIDIISKFKNERIILRQNDSNLGQAESENIGLRMAKGTYIARMDQDDLMMPDRLEKQVQFLDSHPDIAAVGSQYYCIDSSGNLIKKLRWPVGIEANLFYIISGNVPIGDPGVLYRKDVILNLGGYSTKYIPSEDYDLWLRMYLNGYRCDNIADFLTKYRIHSSQVSVVNNKKQIENHNLAFINFYNNLNKIKANPEMINNYLNLLRNKENLAKNNIKTIFNIFFTLLNNFSINNNLTNKSKRNIFIYFINSIKDKIAILDIIEIIKISSNNGVLHFDTLKILLGIIFLNILKVL
tara:strand:- start:210 stop:1205 length:996 start_codon:yes stop_codon:yes gene_type:complete